MMRAAQASMVIGNSGSWACDGDAVPVFNPAEITQHGGNFIHAAYNSW